MEKPKIILRMGKNIEKLMTDKKISAEQLSEKTGIPLNRLKGITEAKYKKPKYEEIVAIANILNASTDYLFGRTK